MCTVIVVVGQRVTWPRVGDHSGAPLARPLLRVPLAILQPMGTTHAFKHIFHPTDLSGSSHIAFIHALKLALSWRASLTMLHMGHREQAWSEMPQVRLTLKRWGVLNNDRDEAEFEGLGFGIRKVVAKGSDPAEACIGYLEEHPTDLLVLATHQGSGGFHPLRRRVATPLARSVGKAALFLPVHLPGFIDPGTGQVNLGRILIPVARDPDPMVSVRAAMMLVEGLGMTGVECTLLHVGSDATLPDPVLPETACCGWRQVHRQGDIVDTIVAVQREGMADLIIMTSEGHDGFLDMLRGSTTERVLERIECPLLALRP